MKKKIDAKLIAKALTDTLTNMAKSAADAIKDDQDKKDGNAGDNKNNPPVTNVSKNIEIKIDEAKLAEEIAKRLNLSDDNSDDANDDSVDDSKVPSEEQISSAVKDVAKKLGIKPSDIQITAKGVKKSKTNADDENDEESDEEFAKKLIGEDNDYESDEYKKKFSKMSSEEKDAELDDYFGNILAR